MTEEKDLVHQQQGVSGQDATASYTSKYQQVEGKGLSFSNTHEAFEKMMQTATRQLDDAKKGLENARHALSGQSIDVTRSGVVSSEQDKSPGSSTTLREEVSQPLQKESKIARE